MGDVLKWEGRLEEAFLEAVQAAGGLQSARPKQVLLALQPQFPELGLRVDQIKWHLQASRRRQGREAEWLGNPEGPVRWTGQLEAAFTAAVERLGGVHQARPKQLWEELSPTYAMLTVQSCKWHIQTLRKRAARAGGGDGGASDEETEDGAGEGRDTESGAVPAGGGSRRSSLGRRQSVAVEPLSDAAQLVASDALAAQQQPTQPQQQQGQPRRRQQPRQQQVGTSSPAARSSRPPAPGIPPAGSRQQQVGWQGMFGGEEAEEARWQAAAAQQRSQGRQRAQQAEQLPWEALLLPAAEAALFRMREGKQRVLQLVGLLELQAANQAKLLATLQGNPASADNQLLRMLALASRSTKERQEQQQQQQQQQQQPTAPVAPLAGSDPALQAALGSVVPALVQRLDEQQPATLATASGHDPASCAVPACRRCAYAARLAEVEAAEQAGVQPAQQQLSSPPASALRQQLQQQQQQQEQQPWQQQQQQQQQHGQGQQQFGQGQQQQQQQQPRAPPAQQGPSSSPPRAPARFIAAASSASPAQALEQVEQAARLLKAENPDVDLQVCAAICRSVPTSNAAGQRAMAAWLVDAGAGSVADVVHLLDSGPQFLGLAVEATRGAGVKLLHWAALLANCKG